MIFYGHHESGHAYKVALTLALAGLEHEFRWVDLDVPASSRPLDVQRACRFGEVPALVDEQGSLVQSNAILLNLALKHACLGGESEVSHRQCREWLFWEANRVGFSAANLRHLVYFEHQVSSDTVTWLRQRLAADLAVLERELKPRSFLVGDQPTIADVSCGAYLFLAADARIDLDPYPSVRTWLARVRALPGWRPPAELMPAPGSMRM